MPYLIYAIDYEGQDEVRELLRSEHRAHLKSMGSRLLASGALLDEDKLKIIGGISLIDTENSTEAKCFADQDPYSKAGIRKETHVIYWRKRWWNGTFFGTDN